VGGDRPEGGRAAPALAATPGGRRGRHIEDERSPLIAGGFVRLTGSGIRGGPFASACNSSRCRSWDSEAFARLVENTRIVPRR